MQTSQQALTKSVETLLVSLRQSGIRQVVLSPGSRSTPVAILLGKLQDQGKLSLYVDVDERSAAFFALGIAKSTAKPVLLVCTSGTAAANYYPAICEAFISKVPLLILTTDRPPELQAIGAPQTIDQVGMYGTHVKNFYQLPVPEAPLTQSSLDYMAYLGQKAVYQAVVHPEGPVHLNLPLRKPLMPAVTGEDYTHIRAVETLSVDEEVDAALTRRLTNLFSGKKGLIIAGPTNNGQQNQAELASFAQQMNWIIIADPLSGLRGTPNALTTGDWIFKTLTQLPAGFQPEIILRTGATLVSAAITDWLKTQSVPVVYMDPDYEWADSSMSTSMVVPVSAAGLAKLNPSPTTSAWRHQWQALDQQIKSAIQSELNGSTLTEFNVAVLLGDCLPSDATLFVSNSLPVRELDAYFSPKDKVIQVLANRGANGIDGLNSTALGVAANRAKTYLYTGDLAFFHDLTGLMMASQYHLDLTVIVQNNNGGGIFSLLPQAEERSQFEKVFGTPLNLNIQAVASLYNADYQRVTTSSALKQVLKKQPSGLTIVEVPTNRATISTDWKRMTQLIKTKIEALFK